MVVRRSVPSRRLLTWGCTVVLALSILSTLSTLSTLARHSSGRIEGGAQGQLALVGVLSRNDRVSRSLRLAGVDFRDRPVKITNPARVKRGSNQPPYTVVFKTWKDEIQKPDFSIVHAEKAIRFLEKVNLTSFQEDDLVFANLVNRTRALLMTGEASSREVVSILWSSTRLLSELPHLYQALGPLLIQEVERRKEEIALPDFMKLVQAADGLREEAPELWDEVNSCIPGLAERADEFSTVELVNIASACGDSQLLQVAQRSVIENAEDLKPPELANFLFSLMSSPEIAEAEELNNVVSRQVRLWKKADIDPHLWRIVVAFARGGACGRQLAKAVARSAMREGLGTLRGWGIAALAWAYRELETPGDGLASFRRHVSVEVELRGFNETQIESSSLGPDGGGNQELCAMWASLGPRLERTPIIAPAPRLRQGGTTSPSSQISPQLSS
mmetsp:Transcript_65316/g.142303  ORF Transcript_65316/g.142303 Transcript_65316/m.142303 type:complete len:445 (+) Transcript_65316:48-1382(+)